jgi:hypothetical protein
MNAIDTYTWMKSRGREYVLRVADGGEAGRVTIEGFCGTSAHAEASGQRWTFKRSGLIKPVLTVQREGESAPLFVSSLTIGGNCEIALGDGRRYRWKALSCLRGEYAWNGDDGVRLIRFQPRSWLRGEQYIEVASDVPRDTATLLALLGGFLKVLAANDAAASTAALVAIVAAS